MQYIKQKLGTVPNAGKWKKQKLNMQKQKEHKAKWTVVKWKLDKTKQNWWYRKKELEIATECVSKINRISYCSKNNLI